MFVDYRGSILGVITWQWRYILFFTLAATAVVGAHALAEIYQPELVPAIRLPALPLGIVGGAIGIFVSFRTNSAYDRWWEGRKLWGRLINTSRHFSSQIILYLEPDEDGAISALQREMVRRHVAYVHVLRCLLRQQDLRSDVDVRQFVDKDTRASLADSSNATHALLHRQLHELQREVDGGRLDLFHQQLMDASVRELLDIQGGCERIKKTPFPRGYGYIAERLILAFGALFPLALVQELGWFTVPMAVLVCSAFLLISEVGRVLEDPFTMFWPALPLSALAKTIEINLRERLGETELPPMPKPDEKGILM